MRPTRDSIIPRVSLPSRTVNRVPLGTLRVCSVVIRGETSHPDLWVDGRKSGRDRTFTPEWVWTEKDGSSDRWRTSVGTVDPVTTVPPESGYGSTGRVGGRGRGTVGFRPPYFRRPPVP